MSRDLIAVLVALGALLLTGTIFWIQMRQAMRQLDEEKAERVRLRLEEERLRLKAIPTPLPPIIRRSWYERLGDDDL